MIKLRVIECSNYIKNIVISNVRQNDGTVIAVFNNSFVIRFNEDEIFHFTNQNENLSPFSLYVEGLNVSEVHENTRACWHYNQFFIDDLFIELGASINSYDQNDISIIDVKKVKLPEEKQYTSIFTDKFNQYRNELIEAYQQNNMDKCSQCIIKMIGLGDGLTPCGDDYILGLIYGLKCTDNKELLQIIKHILCRYVASLTNIISKKFLVCALNGQFSKMIANHDWSTLIQYGNNSGYYTLLGINDSVKSLCKNLIVSE